jgi:F0F1-type ATP synthase delta subunit
MENRQLRNAELYLRDIRTELERRFGLVSADVTSARKLNDELEKQVRSFIKSSTNAKEIEIMEAIDEDLIGGVVISTTEAELDNSVRSRLQKLRSV